MVDPAAVGYRGSAYAFPIERGKIRELALAAGSTNPGYLEADRPPVTPTFLKLAQFLWEPPSGSVIDRVGFDPLNTPLHAAQEFEFHHDLPRAGDELSVRSHVESIRDRPSRRFGTVTSVVITSEFTDRTGSVVATARTTSVAVPSPGDRR